MVMTLAVAARRGPSTCGETIISAVADPNVALILVVVGVLGICAEFCAPGKIVPGVLGGILVLLGLSSFANLPMNWVGVSLLALALRAAGRGGEARRSRDLFGGVRHSP